MKKFKYVLCMVVLCGLIIPFQANAAEDKFVVEGADDITSSTDVNGSAIYAGNNVTVDKNVDGINMLFGNNVTFKGNSEYTLLAGNSINLFGTIEKDGFIFGNMITIDSSFKAKRDVFVFGNEIILKGEIDRDITIYAASVIVEDAMVDGTLKIYADTIEIKGNTEVNTLAYNKDASITQGNQILIENTELLDNIQAKTSFATKLWNRFVSLVGTLIVFVVILFIFPSLFKKLDEKAENIKVIDFFSALGIGAISLVAVPIAMILCISLIVGLQLALLGVTAYGICCYLSFIVFGYIVGNLLLTRVFKKENNATLAGIIGITLIAIIQMIPVINVISLMIILMGLGFTISLLKKA